MDPSDARHQALAVGLDTAVEGLRKKYVGLSIGALADGVRATLGVGSTGPSGRAIDDDTSFQIGSITKVFTALLLADAVHRGEVDLDQRLDSIIPDASSHPGGRPITLGDLATHSSGLPRLPPGLWRQALRHRDDPYVGFGPDELTDALRRPPKRPPGRVRYSNYGAGALGEALSRALDATFAELIADRITGPLGMRRTGITRRCEADNWAQGHSRRGRPVPDWHLAALAGAGALRSTVADLLVFIDAHLRPDESHLSAAINLAMPPREQAGRNLHVALGWHVLRNRDGSVWWHNGGTGGFFSFVAFDPEATTGVAVLANTARSVDRIGMTLLGSIHPRR